ncbi:MAG: hypothetical protein AAF483_09655 [Planctomycetota bacterium]
MKTHNAAENQFKRRPARRLAFKFALSFCLALIALPVLACNIPVFRYALERWRSDRMQVLVFIDQELSASDQAAVARLRTASVATNGSANLEVQTIDLREPAKKNETRQAIELWESIQTSSANAKPPFVAVQGKHPRGPYLSWSGKLADSGAILSSPARLELGRRLLAGKSVVWLVLQSQEDQAANERVTTLLRGQSKELSADLELPEGIGLPGSELFSEVPLLLEFSVLEIDRNDNREEYLIESLKGFQPEAFEADEPLVIPVFGRGRALEVIPASKLTDALVRDLSAFLCAACSCQVKEQNPGFDLLLERNWDLELFGEEGEKPPASENGLGQQKRVLLDIPPGKSK